LQRAPERVAGESLQAFGEVVDSEQEQAESTQERYGGRGIHRLRLESNFSNVEKISSKFIPQRHRGRLSPDFSGLGVPCILCARRSLADFFSAKIRIGLAGICANT
jgi:hypothetical protein